MEIISNNFGIIRENARPFVYNKHESLFLRPKAWDTIKQSKLIDSIICGVPIPAFFLADCLNGNIAIIDGEQRIKALKDFFDGNLRLEGLSNDLNGKVVGDIPKTYTRRIFESSLLIYVVRATIKEEKEFTELYTRINGRKACLKKKIIKFKSLKGKI